MLDGGDDARIWFLDQEVDRGLANPVPHVAITIELGAAQDIGKRLNP
jgi:hypothetical protein